MPLSASDLVPFLTPYAPVPEDRWLRMAMDINRNRQAAADREAQAQVARERNAQLINAALIRAAGGGKGALTATETNRHNLETERLARETAQQTKEHQGELEQQGRDQIDDARQKVLRELGAKLNEAYASGDENAQEAAEADIGLTPFGSVTAEPVTPSAFRMRDLPPLQPPPSLQELEPKRAPLAEYVRPDPSLEDVQMPALELLQERPDPALEPLLRLAAQEQPPLAPPELQQGPMGMPPESGREIRYKDKVVQRIYPSVAQQRREERIRAPIQQNIETSSPKDRPFYEQTAEGVAAAHPPSAEKAYEWHEKAAGAAAGRETARKNAESNAYYKQEQQKIREADARRRKDRAVTDKIARENAAIDALEKTGNEKFAAATKDLDPVMKVFGAQVLRDQIKRIDESNGALDEVHEAVYAIARAREGGSGKSISNADVKMGVPIKGILENVDEWWANFTRNRPSAAQIRAVTNHLKRALNDTADENLRTYRRLLSVRDQEKEPRIRKEINKRIRTIYSQSPNWPQMQAEDPVGQELDRLELPGRKEMPAGASQADDTSAPLPWAPPPDVQDAGVP